uniref:C3H1-type domain-containing protein n=1 Tax=Hanusia phi TaxID=3032 RepID=A0A7S0EY75_9CRYP|mmetsp:Transcript_34058/g.76662  ORF Transcript_34058/g.76662 Transcript_34058/m.76662 type:complete len:421 (+) Transcript_34058:325-1587(+)|eukprot:767649-Hanusia_phi.AAC.3
MSVIEDSMLFEQLDKCLQMCEHGDAVHVINALHSLNGAKQETIEQLIRLQPSENVDFVSTFLVELELALELCIAPSPKLGTIDGGLPFLYYFHDDELNALASIPSPSSKEQVARFLNALDVPLSEHFASRGIRATVVEFLRHQVKPDLLQHQLHREREKKNLSWADQSSSDAYSSDNDSDIPPLEEGTESEGSEDCPALEYDSDDMEEAGTLSPNEDVSEDEDDDDSYVLDEAAELFLWAMPTKHRETCSRECEGNASSAVSKAILEQRQRQAEIFVKTRICKNWKETGFCRFGDRCNFAHGDSELRTVSPSVVEAAARPAARKQECCPQDKPTVGVVAAARNYKTQMCKNFEAHGFCGFGDKCNFAHGVEELRTGSRPVLDTRLFKTRLCKTFEQKGKCPYGDNCTYAHGTSELVSSAC